MTQSNSASSWKWDASRQRHRTDKSTDKSVRDGMRRYPKDKAKRGESENREENELFTIRRARTGSQAACSHRPP